MPKIMVNYKVIGNGKNIKVLENEKVFPDMPIAIADYGRDYKEATLVQSPVYTFPEIMEMEEIERIIADQNKAEKNELPEENKVKKEKKVKEDIPTNSGGE